MNIHLPRFSEENRLIDFVDEERSFQLHPETLDAWGKMKEAAESDGIKLHVISAFRSVARQSEIIEEKKRKGIPEAVIFRVSAPPGYSEHHTGRAIDIGTRNFTDLEEEFENSEAFCWLMTRANQFGFRLSYHRENPYGIAYEPWHWFFEGNAQQISGADGV
jgi:D-alanyl-D-alanine carboxypeptidase